MMKKNAPYSSARRKANEQVADSSVAPAYKALNAAKFPVNAVQKMKSDFRDPTGSANQTTPATKSQEPYTPTPKWQEDLSNKVNPQPARRDSSKKQFRGQTDY